jgi:diketogulonate reductase-like aldo/keto reductase
MEGNEGSEEGRFGEKYRCFKVCPFFTYHHRSSHIWARADNSFSVDQLKEIIHDSGVTPAVNQIRFHPKVLAESEALLEFHKEHGIVTEGYSPIKPLRDGTSPGLVKVVGKIAKERGVEPDQVLLAWSKAKGYVVSSSYTVPEIG